jgi:hypothetical protein
MDVEKRAQSLGMSFTDVVVDALSAALGVRRPARTALLSAVALWVAAEYPAGFPPDVTRLVFLHIRDNPALRSLYDEAIKDDRKDPAGTRQAELNQTIGKALIHLLFAQPGARAQCPPGELISSYTLLDPALY